MIDLPRPRKAGRRREAAPTAFEDLELFRGRGTVRDMLGPGLDEEVGLEIARNCPSAAPAAASTPGRVTRAPAFVLHVWPWSETSLLVDALTREYGRVFLVAKGARRPSSQYRSYLVPFHPLLLSWTGRNEAKQLREALWQGSWEPADGEAALSAWYVNELLIRLTAREMVLPGLFEHYAYVVRALHEGGAAHAPLLRSFEWALLKRSGWFPSVEEDPEGLPAGAARGYSFVEGVIRPVREGELPVEGRGVYTAEAVADLVEGRFSEKGRQNAHRDLLREVLLFHMGGRTPASRRVMHGLIGLSRLTPAGDGPDGNDAGQNTKETNQMPYTESRPLGPVCVDVAGTELTERERERIAHPMTGMVILFTRNYTDREQLKRLTDEIHAVRPGIIIAVDHEGGRVQRFREGFTEVPSMAELRSRENPASQLEAAGIVLAAELRAVGVDFTFAPVLDIDHHRSAVIGDRSLGETPFEVTENARALISGLRQGGMASCGKHFPGHGWASADSHVAMPVDERCSEDLDLDMRPYRKLPELESVMTAHVAYDAYDSETATFCPRLLKDVLRDRLKFDGFVFSDDLTMKGSGGGTITERAQRALAAGCDMVLVCNDPDAADELLANLVWERTADFDRRLARLAPQSPVSERLVRTSRELLLHPETGSGAL